MPCASVDSTGAVVERACHHITPLTEPFAKRIIIAMNQSSSDITVATRDPIGPPAGILALVTLALTVGSLISGMVFSGGAGFVSPFYPADHVVAYYVDNPGAVRLSAMLQFGSAVPLGIYAATMYARQLRLGIRVPGPGISFFGGTIASAMLILSALINWVLSQPEITTDGTLTRALAFISFATGGFGFVIGMGLLVAGTAVPALILRRMPRWFVWAGLVIAALSELSFLAMNFEQLQFLLPIGRFGGLLWLVGAGFLLPHTRSATNQEPRK